MSEGLSQICNGDFASALGKQADLAAETALSIVERTVDHVPSALRKLEVIGKDEIADAGERSRFLGIIEAQL